MKIIIDTNVLISGIFFGDPPSRILKSWRNNQIELIVSEKIFEEYKSDVKIIISGDKHLLAEDGYQEIEVLTPTKFIAKYLHYSLLTHGFNGHGRGESLSFLHSQADGHDPTMKNQAMDCSA